MASTPTTNLAYDKPAIGDRGWGTTMNDNLDAIDTDVGTEHISGGAHGPKVTIVQTANDNVLTVSQTTAATAVVINITNSGTGADISGNSANWTISKIGEFVGARIALTDTSTNGGMSLTQSGAAIALNLNKSHTGGNRAVVITNAGTGVGLNVIQNANAVALDIDKSNTGNANVIDLINAGTGDGIFINQDGNGVGLSIDSEATGQPLIELAPITGNSRGDIAFGTVRIASPTSPSQGDIWYDGTLERLEIRMGGATLNYPIATRFGAGYGALLDLTISSGAVSASARRHRINAETGTSDILDTINSSPQAQPGDTLVIQAASGDTITVSTTLGNIRLNNNANI